MPNERGPRGDHGQHGETGPQGPRGPASRNILNIIGYFVLVIGIVVTIRLVLEEGRQQDIALCRQQEEGIAVVRELVTDALDLVENTPPEIVAQRPVEYERARQFYTEKIEELSQPVPCIEKLGLEDDRT